MSPAGPGKPQCFAIRRGAIKKRADASYALLSTTVEALSKTTRFPLVTLGDLATKVQYGTSALATAEPIGLPVLRMNNLQANGWDLSDLKYLDLPAKEAAHYCLNVGDIVFNRTNSKELVGKCEVFRAAGKWLFASYLIRVAIDDDLALPEFVAAFLSGGAGRAQIDQLSRQIVGMSNINAQEIRSIKIPLPGKDVQTSLVQELQAARIARDARLTQADAMLSTIDDLVLAELGLTAPKKDKFLAYAVPVGELKAERRFDPYRFAPFTRKLRMMMTQSSYQSHGLSQLIDTPISGDWGEDETTRSPEREYIDCLIIRATEFSNARNLILDNDYAKCRWVEQKSFEYRQLQDGDILLEKSGGGPYQPVGRVALIKPEHLNCRAVCFSNFIMRLRPHNDICPAYLWAFLGMMNRIGLTESMQAQTHGIRNLKLEEYLNQPVPVPPIRIQKRIATDVAKRFADADRLGAEAAALWAKALEDFERKLLAKGAKRGSKA